jgi:hypothetical protein
MLFGQVGNPALQCQSGARCSTRVIGLVSSVVEHGHDGIADELFHLPAELTCEQWGCDPPVGIEYSCNLGRR